MFLRKEKSGIYYVYYQDYESGKRKKISTKSTQKNEALKFLTNLNSHIESERVKGFISISLNKFSFEFLKYSEAIHTQKTNRDYRTTFNFLSGYFGDVPLIQISQIKLEQYIHFRIKTASIYQARKDLINLSSAFNKAVQDGYLINNPAKGIKRIKTPEKLPLYFTKSEFNQLLEVIPAGRFKQLVELAVNTGLRQAELLNLNWNNINFKNRLIILDNQTVITKSKKVRTIPLNLRCLQILNEMEAEKTGKKLFDFNPDYVTHQFKKYVRQTTVNHKLHFHSLRSSFASWLVQSGISINVIKELLGHADIKTSMIYSFVSADNLLNAVDIL